MNSIETARAALSKIRTLFPAAFKTMSRKEGEAILAEWSSQLDGIPADTVVDAIARLAKKQRYVPHISEVFAELRDRLEISDAIVSMHTSWSRHGIESPYTDEQIAEERRISAALSGVLVTPKTGGESA